MTKHLGSWESTHGYRLDQHLPFFRALPTSRVLNNSTEQADAWKNRYAKRTMYLRSEGGYSFLSQGTYSREFIPLNVSLTSFI